MASHITYYGYLIPWDGYGLSSCLFLNNFHERATLTSRGRAASTLFEAIHKYPAIDEAVTRPIPDCRWHIDHTPPITYGEYAPFGDAPKKVLATMWELHKLPRAWRPIFDKFDHFVVPDPAQVAIFVRSGVHPDRITIIPDYVDLDFWSAETTQPDPDLFRFFTWGVMYARKCPQEIIDAFCKAFPDEKDVRLTIKTMHGKLDAVSNDERITIIDRIMDDVELRNTVGAHDCIMAISKGEGYGCCPIQAWAMGKPVIINGAFSLRSKWDENCMYTVEDDGLVPCPPSESYPYPEDGHWFKVNVNRIAQRMREVYENRGEAKRKGNLAKIMVQKYSVEAITRKWKKFIDNLD